MDPINAPYIHWQELPTELLCIMFRMLDVTSLTRCMFVCRHWNTAAQYVAEHKNLWKKIVTEYITGSGASFHLKSVGLTWRDCFVNQLLWNHASKAAISVKHVYSENSGIKNIHVYKNNLIVVHSNGVTYYNIESGVVQRQIDRECEDFEETNEFLFQYTKHSRSGTLHLYRKKRVTDYNIDKLNEIEMTDVVHYRVVGDCWYILNPWNSLILHKLKYVKHMSRYYGTDCATLGLTVLKDDVFVLLKRGEVIKSSAYFGCEKILDVKIPTSMMLTKMFHRLGFVFGVPKHEPFIFNRSDVNQERIFVFECPDLACVAEHGEILVMGHCDGQIKLYMPRIYPKENVLLFEKQFTEIPALEHNDMIAVDVYEDRGRNHVFIATESHVAHVVFDHNNMEDDYVWSEYPYRVSLKPDQPTL